jgi:hypothetical protein
MLRKFTAFFLVTSCINAFAMAPIQKTAELSRELGRTFDEMNYTLNVEWDQKDPAFFKDTVEKFEDNIKALQSAGLSNQELINYTLTKIKDKQTQQDVAEIAKTISDSQMTSDQARAFALEKLNKGYSQGTSWSGSRMGIKLVLILAVIIIIVCACDDDNDHDRPRRDDDECDWGHGGYGFTSGDNCYPR